MDSCGRQKDIKYTSCFSKGQTGAEFCLNSLQFRRCSSIQQGRGAIGGQSCARSAFAASPPWHAHTTKAEERMDRTGSVIVNLARAIAVRALPITLDGLIRLKLRQLLLQMQLNFFGFLKERAKSSRRASSTLRLTLAISPRCRTPSTPTSSTEMIILNCAVNEYPFQKTLDYLDILTPTFFPLSIRSSCRIRAKPSSTPGRSGLPWGWVARHGHQFYWRHRSPSSPRSWPSIRSSQKCCFASHHKRGEKSEQRLISIFEQQ